MPPSLLEFSEGTAEPMIGLVRGAFMRALAEESSLDPAVLQITGMSGKKYRMFINNLAGSMPNARYLEVGSWAGSTLCAAINGCAIQATAIDNWSQFGGPKETFLGNVARFRTREASVSFIESDFREVDYRAIGLFNIYLFDGPHEMQDQYDGLAYAMPALDRKFVLVIDDWNWPNVRQGTLSAIRELRLSMLYSMQIRTTMDDTHPTVASEHSDWHNGYFISVMQQAALPPRAGTLIA